MLNNVCLLGKLHSKSEIRYTNKKNYPVINFCIQVPHKLKVPNSNSNLSFIYCVAFGPYATTIGEKALIGGLVQVVGALQQMKVGETLSTQVVVDTLCLYDKIDISQDIAPREIIVEDFPF